MILTKFLTNVRNIFSLPDQPSQAEYSADDIKNAIDKAGSDIQTFINETLTVEVDAEIEALETSISDHKTSSDHDARYYTENEIDTKVTALNEEDVNLQNQVTSNDEDISLLKTRASNLESDKLDKITYDAQVINAGNSNAEIVAARVKEDGTTFASLPLRLNGFDAQLSDTMPYDSNKIYVRNHPNQNNEFTTLLDAMNYAKPFLYVRDVDIVIRSGIYDIENIMQVSDFNYPQRLYINAENDVLFRGSGYELDSPTIEDGLCTYDLPVGFTIKTFSLYDTTNKKRVRFAFDYDRVNNCTYKATSQGNDATGYYLVVPAMIILPTDTSDLYLYVKNKWDGFYVKVTSIVTNGDSSRNVYVNVTQAFTPYDVNSIPFIMFNSQEFVKDANTFYIDYATKKIIFKPDDITNIPRLYLSKTTKLLNFTNSSNVTVSNIKFGYTTDTLDDILAAMSITSGQAANIYVASNSVGVISLDGCSDISFYDVATEYIGYCGFVLCNGTNNCKVINGTVSNSDMGGVYVDDDCDNNIIENCEIFNIGQFVKQCCGVLIKGTELVGNTNESRGNQILDCSIHDLIYSGISIGHTWEHLSTNDNILFAAPETIITGNKIYNIGCSFDTLNPDYDQLDDLGGIYTLGNCKGSKVYNNIIGYIRGTTKQANGIYTDSGSTEIEIYDNIVFKVDNNAFHQYVAKGTHNIKAYNNILLGHCNVQYVGSESVWVIGGDVGSAFHDNIILYVDDSIAYQLIEIDSKIYANTYIVDAVVNFTNTVEIGIKLFRPTNLASLVINKSMLIDGFAQTFISNLVNRMENSPYYEEGTWAPIIVGQTTAGVNTYTIQEGTYIKIGKQVTATFRVQANVVDAAMAGAISIAGLPFVSAAATFYSVALGAYYYLNAITGGVTAYLNPNNTSMSLRTVATVSGGAEGYMDAVNIVHQSYLMGQVTYKVK